MSYGIARWSWLEKKRRQKEGSKPMSVISNSRQWPLNHWQWTLMLLQKSYFILMVTCPAFNWTTSVSALCFKAYLLKRCRVETIVSVRHITLIDSFLFVRVIFILLVTTTNTISWWCLIEGMVSINKSLSYHTHCGWDNKTFTPTFGSWNISCRLIH